MVRARLKSIHSVILLILLIIAGFQIGYIARFSVWPNVITRYPWVVYPEIRSIRPAMNFGDLSKLFIGISHKKGAVYAFEVLKRAPLPANTDIHLLGHVIGDELYKQAGKDGIVYCTQDFRNACSHSIVVGYFLKYGESGLPVIAETCRKAPGGRGAYTMCFHGLGHGILAAVNYELPRAIALCQKTGSQPYNFREASECTGGAIMEIISGGFHDKARWSAASKTYLKTDDPLFPCNTDMVPDGSKELCYEYMTPHIVAAAGGDLNNNPPDEVLKKAFRSCTDITEIHGRSACMRGFGKEFIVLAHNREIRTFDTLTDAEIARTYYLCALAPDRAGETECDLHAVDSVYWGGENDHAAAVRFCSKAGDNALRAACFEHLIDAMHYFEQNPDKRTLFCRDIPSEFQKRCSL